MRESVTKIFNEHRKPKHCGRRDVQDANRQVLTLVSRMQAQTAEFRLLLAEAENDPDLPDALRNTLNMLSVGEAGVERQTSVATEALRELTKLVVQRDRLMSEAEAGLTAWDARQARESRDGN